MKTREPTTQPTSAIPPQPYLLPAEKTLTSMDCSMAPTRLRRRKRSSSQVMEYFVNTHTLGTIHPYRIPAKFLNFWIPSPLSAFGTDLQHIIHATYLASSSFWWPLPLQVQISYVDGPLGKSNYVVHNIVICFLYSQVYEAIALLFSL